MSLVPTVLLTALWACLFGYWGLASTRTENTEHGQSPRSLSRLIHLAMFVAAFALTLTEFFRIGPLGERFLPESALFTWAGLALTALSIGFAIWARYHLGRFWSGVVTIKTGHQLIRSGPYAVARHPIYTGFACGMLGTAIAIGEWRGLLAFLLVFIAYLRKIPMEESLLLKQFGAEYERYRREVKALIPFLL